VSDTNDKEAEASDEELDSVASEAEDAESPPFERRSAQAMVATYLQMTRYAELARMLHGARLRATELRVAEAQNLDEVERLQRQIEAQRAQGECIDLAVTRFRRHTHDLKSFSEAGLTPEDFTALGLDELLGTDPDREAAAAGAPASGKETP